MPSSSIAGCHLCESRFDVAFANRTVDRRKPDGHDRRDPPDAWEARRPRQRISESYLERRRNGPARREREIERLEHHDGSRSRDRFHGVDCSERPERANDENADLPAGSAERTTERTRGRSRGADGDDHLFRIGGVVALEQGDAATRDLGQLARCAAERERSPCGEAPFRSLARDGVGAIESVRTRAREA
jgi:hypothetical protein